MYVCMYVYVRTSGVACVCAFMHVCIAYVLYAYIRKYDVCMYMHMRL